MRKPLAAVVVLAKLYPNRPALPQHRDMSRQPVRRLPQQLGQVQRGVVVVVDAEQQDLAVEIVDPSDRTLGNVGRQREWVGDDGSRPGTGGGKRLRVIAPEHAGQSPEGVGHDAELFGRASGERIERRVAVAGPGRHHQRAFRTQRVAQCRDQSGRSPFDRTSRAEGAVHQEDVALLHAESAQLPGDLGPGERAVLSHGKKLPRMPRKKGPIAPSG